MTLPGGHAYYTTTQLGEIMRRIDQNPKYTADEKWLRKRELIKQNDWSERTSDSHIERTFGPFGGRKCHCGSLSCNR